MIIKNPNTVENGLDLVKADIPDSFSELYMILRPLLKRYFTDQIVFGNAYNREFYTDQSIQDFIRNFCEHYLGEESKFGFKSRDAVARLYDCVVSDARGHDIKEVLEKFRKALGLAVKKLTLGYFPAAESQFVYSVMSQITTFEIIETPVQGKDENVGAEQ